MSTVADRVAVGAHFPSGKFTDVTGGNGGPSRHQCGGCGDPIVSSYDKWLSVYSGQQACRNDIETRRAS